MVNPNDVPRPKPEDFNVPKGDQVSPEMLKYLYSIGEWNGKRLGFQAGREAGASEAFGGMLVLIAVCVVAVFLWEFLRWM